MQTPIGWDAAARRMRAQGKASDEIAMALGQTVAAVRVALRGTRRTPLAALGAGQAKAPCPARPAPASCDRGPASVAGPPQRNSPPA